VWADYANAVPPDVRPALFDAARNIAAGWMNEQGKTEPTADFAEVMRQAVHRAGGMLGSAGEGSATGGFVRWNGRYAWLPPEMSRTDFQSRISRASPREWVNAAVDAGGQSGQYRPAPPRLGRQAQAVHARAKRKGSEPARCRRSRPASSG
jgi:hypothetical protein